ncbi:MAG: LssY C-terminal domain-containing protein [Deltaproteobacteria bacterium]
MCKFLSVFLILALFSCGANYTPRAPEEVPFLKRAQTQSRGGLTVTAAVLSREESEEVFGVDLAAKGIQPVWLEIENNTDAPFAFMPIALDLDYFSPNEVSWLNHFKFNRSLNRKMDEHFSEHSIEVEYIIPGEKDKGFVYSNLDPGIKYVNVTLYQLDRIERFVFLFEVPGIQPDYQNVDFEELYSNDEIVNIENENDLRAVLENIPCCTVDKKGEGEGHPVNIILIGDPDDTFSGIIRRGWDVTEADTDSFDIDLRKMFSTARYRTFPMTSLHMYGRRQDISLQKSRHAGHTPYRQRNQMRLWLTPFRYRGDSVWIGSVSRDIGSDLRVRKYWFAAQEIDPDIDETRDYVVEDLVLSQQVHKLGYVKGTGAANSENPRTDLFGHPWWSDGYRAVFLFGKDSITLGDMEFFPWEDIHSVPSLELEFGNRNERNDDRGLGN